VVASSAVGLQVPPLPDDPRQPGRRDQQDWARVAREAGPLLGIGTSLAVSVLLGVLVGRWADDRWGREPLFTILGAMTGLVVGMYGFVRTVISKKP
jgi:F0F1-type ATP synthase assembly protein I